jgi:hypothetical protein
MSALAINDGPETASGTEPSSALERVPFQWNRSALQIL